MSKKHHGGPAPVPPGNQQKTGPGGGAPGSGDADPVQSMNPNAGASFEEQDPQRRLGGFETAGEHSRQQPGPLNDGDTHSK